MTDQASSPVATALVRLQRCDALAALLLAGALALCAAGRMYVGTCGQCHDDGIYTVMAKALAEGDGYRLISFPGEPAQTKYPPLYPAVLALLWKLWPVFPDNLLLLQGFSLLCGAGFVGLVYLYLVRFGHATRGVAFSAVLLCTVHPAFVFYSLVTMSEMPFAVLLLAMLWWLETALRNPDKDGPGDFLGGLLLALPFLCRSIGLLFVPLGLLLLWQRGKRWRWTAFGALTGTLPWLLWCRTHPAPSDPIQGWYTDYLGWWGAHGLPALAEIIRTNLLLMAAKISGLLFDGVTGPLYDGGQVAIWSLLNVSVGLAALTMLALDVRRGQPLATLMAAYLLVVCVFPWVPQRYIMPLAPLLALYLLRFLQLPGQLAGVGHLWSHVARIGLAICVSANLVDQVRLIVMRHRDDSPTAQLGEARHGQSAMRRLLSWLRDHSKAEDVVAAGIDPTIYLHTGRQAYYPIVFPPLALFYGQPYPTEEILAGSLAVLEQHRPRFIVLTANFHGEIEFRAWVALLRQRFPDRLVRVYHDDEDGRFEIYEVRYPLAP